MCIQYFDIVQDPEVSAATAVEEDFLITVASHGGLGVSILMLSIVLFTYSVFRSVRFPTVCFSPAVPYVTFVTQVRIVGGLQL